MLQMPPIAPNHPTHSHWKYVYARVCMNFCMSSNASITLTLRPYGKTLPTRSQLFVFKYHALQPKGISV